MVLRHQTPEYTVRWSLLFQTVRFGFRLIYRRLAAVNFFLGCVGVTQVTRIVMYQRSAEGKSAGEVVEEDAKDVADTAAGVVKNPEGAAGKAVK